MIRGGSGLYFASPVSNVTFSPQFYSHLVAATFANDGRADFITNPTNGVTATQIFAGTVATPAQTVRTIAPDFKSPYTWQSSIGFQKQINSVTGFDVDLTHWTEYRDTRTIDANLAVQPGDRLQRGERRGADPAEPGLRRRVPVRVRRQARADRDRVERNAPPEEQGSRPASPTR